MLHHAGDAGCALALVNARISPGSYSSWRRARPVIAALLDHFELILAQSPEDEAHLNQLGAGRVLCLGNLKFAGTPLGADPTALAAFQESLGVRPHWLAASTHEGEEAIVADAHRRLAESRPGLVTLIAPRHPDRGAALAANLRAENFRVAWRSAQEPLEPDTEIYLADTLGELGLWYRLAEVVFVGGSFVEMGGHNPLEPAKLGCAVLCGPHRANIVRVAREMTEAGAMGLVEDAESLAAAVGALLDDSAERASQIEAARRYADAQSGVLDDVVEALAPLLDRAAARAL